MRLLLTAFFLETGVVLLLAPWSEFWDRNYFAQALPFIHALMINNFVRGAVSGLGIAPAGAAVGEIDENLQPLLDDGMRFDALDVCYKANATSVPLELRIVKPLFRRQPHLKFLKR